MKKIKIFGLLMLILTFSGCSFISGKKVRCDNIDKPFLFVPVEKEPVVINMDEVKSKIGYPKLAKESGIEGEVILRILVDKKGNYVKHIVMQSPHPLLTKAVEEHISELKFKPAIKEGKKICYWLTLPFRFKLI